MAKQSAAIGQAIHATPTITDQTTGRHVGSRVADSNHRLKRHR